MAPNYERGQRRKPSASSNTREANFSPYVETAESGSDFPASLERHAPGWRLEASRALESLSEFLASRNAINQNASYDKLVNDELGQRRTQPTAAATAGSVRVQLKASGRAERRHSLRSAPSETEQRQQQRRPLTFNARKESERHTWLLARALFNRRQKNKTKVLAKLIARLLRRPIVLAALFSLLLFAALLLFALSLHQQQQQQQQQRLKLEAFEEEEQQQPVARHRISSRHLTAGTKANSSSEQLNFKRALTVQTECGAFVGAPDSRGIQFKGIPYATPPVGPRRWSRPRPVWEDAELCKPELSSQAAKSRAHCAQLSPMQRAFAGQEDCLYLDIFTPQLDQLKRLPVMVYIHGGFLTFGSSGQGAVNWLNAQPSTQLASELQVVFVAFNFRLQALGFMSLAQLAHNRGAEGGEANYGLWDQLVAINWVKRNIEPFGGDPNNVVLFGPDAASALPLALLSRAPLQLNAPPASNHLERLWHKHAHNNEKLFRAAWLTNPAVFFHQTNELADEHYQNLFLSSDFPCTQETHEARLLECLLKLSAEEVLKHYLGKDDPSFRLDDENSLPLHGVFANQLVTVDQELVQSSFPFAAPQKLDWANVSQLNSFATADLLIGSTAQAVEFWPNPKGLDQWDWRQFKRYVATTLNSFNTDTYKRASQVYGVANSSPTNSSLRPKQLYLTMVSDIKQICPVNELAVNMRARGNRVQRYIVDSKPPKSEKASGAPNAGQKRAKKTNDSEARLTEQAAAEQTQTKREKLEYAFHMRDLLAFFGFERDPDFKLKEEDLRFQATIRALVKQFVHINNDQTPVANKHEIATTSDSEQNKFTLFSLDGSSSLTTAHKERECKMWKDHLVSSYAWVS